MGREHGGQLKPYVCGCLCLLVAALLGAACSASTTVGESTATAADETPQTTASADSVATPVPATPEPEPSPTPRPEPSPTPEPTPGLDGLVWSSCPGGECTTVTVPLDYDEPDGPTIELAVARRQARDDDERIGSLFVNFGGPGGESTAIFPLAVQTLRSSFPQFDIVTWDTRGVGKTERLACDDLDTSGVPVIEVDPADGFDDELAEQEAEFAEVVACAEASGPIVDHLGTANVARDMESIRLAIGGEPMNYLGLSYGTMIGWVYASLFGESVRSMILDGALPGGPISADDFVDQLAGFQRTFEYFDELCESAETCQLADEGLAEATERVAEQLRENPIDLGDGEFFGEIEFRMGVLLSMYQTPESFGRLLSGWIDDAGNGDANGLRGVIANSSSNFTPGSYQAVLCADGGEFPGPDGQAADYEATFAVSPTFGMLGEVVRCDLWPGQVDPLPEIDSSAAPTILVVGNTFDPATRYENAVLLDEQLADSVLLTIEGGGHTAVLDHPCATKIALAYLNDLIAPPEGTVCFTPGLFGVQLVNEDNGPRVRGVLEDSAAEAAGVQINDVVISVDGAPIMVVTDLPDIAAGTPSEWTFLRAGEEIQFTLTPDPRPWN